VQDAAGNSIVIEYLEGKVRVFDDPLGVMSNSPSFDWHMTNLRNYVNFSMTNVPPVKLGSVTLQPFGQGSGMLGMPEDFTPPSRFVRALAFSQSVPPSAGGRDAVLQAFHVLNQFDIPKGAAWVHGIPSSVKDLFFASEWVQGRSKNLHSISTRDPRAAMASTVDCARDCST
jgi:choloylglycine hydrolase